MVCGYFRVFVTILAAFGAFFGYLCRLNLSLVIEEMCVKDLSGPMESRAPSGELLEASAGELENLQFLSKAVATFYSEEQNFAGLSRRNLWLTSCRRSASSNRTTKPQTFGASRPIRAAVSFPFSVEFDVTSQAKGKTGPGQSDDESLTPAASIEPNGSFKLTETDAHQSDAALQGPDRAEKDCPQSKGPLLKWSKENRNDLLGAFFWGYVFLQVPAGRAAEIYGAKLLLLVLGLGSGLSSLVFPYAALHYDDVKVAWVIRVIMGISQAGLFPASYVLLCEWLPKNERSSWLAVPSSFGRIGTIVMNLVIPVIMRSYTWEWVFYASGLVTLAWTLLVIVFASDSPRKSFWLSKKELLYIESHMERSQTGGTTSTLDLTASTSSGLDAKTTPKPGINWLKMLRSRAMWMFTVVMFSSEWSNMLLLIKLPGFLGPAMRMSIDEIGNFSSILVLIYCVAYPLSGVIASRLEARETGATCGCMSSLRVRKLFEAMAQSIQAAGCLVIAFWQDKMVVLCALTAMMFGRSLVGGGQCLMPPELSKDYPGSVLALANSFANCAGIFGPMLLNVLVTDPDNYADWRSLWLASAGLFITAGLLFCLLADNRPQNYSRKPKLAKSHSTSLGQLTLPTYVPPASMRQDADHRLESDEIIRMGAFSRVSSEPQTHQPSSSESNRRPPRQIQRRPQ